MALLVAVIAAAVAGLSIGAVAWWTTPNRPAVHPIVKSGLLAVFVLVIVAVCVVIAVSIQHFADLT